MLYLHNNTMDYYGLCQLKYIKKYQEGIIVLQQNIVVKLIKPGKGEGYNG